jgi:predicted dehydrogenase
MTDKLKVALIGCGKIGYSWDPSDATGSEAYSHFAAINQSERFELVAVADTSPEILEELKTHDVLECEQDWRTMLGKREKWDLVVIATPDETHSDILIEMSDFNPRCLFVEKPLCMDSRSGEQIIKSFENKGISLLVNYSRRFMSEYSALGEVIREGRMGTPLCLTIHYTGGLLHNGFHFLDLAHWFFGPPEKVRIYHDQQRRNSSEDCSATIRCSYKSGLQFNLIGVGYESPTHHQVEFIGSEGGFRILNNERIEWQKSVPMERFEGFRKLSAEKYQEIEPGLALPNAYRSIAEHLEKSIPFERNGQSCLALNYMIENGQTILPQHS